jgi:hypothetical protein
MNICRYAVWEGLFHLLLESGRDFICQKLNKLKTYTIKLMFGMEGINYLTGRIEIRV